jgi:hypothetical protein
MSEQVKNRLKSFAWRTGVMVVVALLNAISTNLGLLELPTPYVVFIGLILSEVTKYLNTYVKA